MDLSPVIADKFDDTLDENSTTVKSMWSDEEEDNAFDKAVIKRLASSYDLETHLICKRIKKEEAEARVRVKKEAAEEEERIKKEKQEAIELEKWKATLRYILNMGGGSAGSSREYGKWVLKNCVTS